MITPTVYVLIVNALEGVADQSAFLTSALNTVLTNFQDAGWQDYTKTLSGFENAVNSALAGVSTSVSIIDPGLMRFVIALQNMIVDISGSVDLYYADNSITVGPNFALLSKTAGFLIDPIYIYP